MTNPSDVLVVDGLHASFSVGFLEVMLSSGVLEVFLDTSRVIFRFMVVFALLLEVVFHTGGWLVGVG